MEMHHRSPGGRRKSEQMHLIPVRLSGFDLCQTSSIDWFGSRFSEDRTHLKTRPLQAGRQCFMEADGTLLIRISDLSGPVCSNQDRICQNGWNCRKWLRDRMKPCRPRGACSKNHQGASLASAFFPWRSRASHCLTGPRSAASSGKDTTEGCQTRRPSRIMR